MGYYTSFDLSYDLTGTPFKPEEIDTEISKMNVLELYGGWFGVAKWYNHQEDMAYLSMKFPGVLFTLYGNGDDSEDFWYEYYKNGMVQNCPAHITFDDYDESLLIPVLDMNDDEEKSKYAYSYAS